MRPDVVTPLWGVIVSVEMPKRPRHPLIEGVLTIAHGDGVVTDDAPFTLLDSPSYLAVGSTMLQGERAGRECLVTAPARPGHSFRAGH